MKNSILELLKEGKSTLTYNDGDKIRLERWSVDDVLKLEPYYKNRPVDNRVKKKRNELKTFLPTHLEIKIGRCMKEFGPYNVGDLFVLDGNTRSAVWKLFHDLRPTTLLMVTIIDVFGEEEGDKIYYSIDSLTSAETSQEKIGGYFRSIGYTCVSKRNKEGKISTTVNDATKFIEYFGDIPHKLATMNNKLDYILEEFKFVDGLYLDPIPNLSSNLHTCLLMIARKYKCNNERFLRMVEHMKYDTCDLNDKHYCDGVFYVTKCLFGKNKDKWFITGRQKAPELLYEMLYSLDCYINNIPLKKKKNYEVSKNQKLKEFFQSYMN